MSVRLTSAACIVTFLLILPGCPPAGAGLLGVWVFTVNQVATGVELQANGQVNVFPVSNGPTLLGTLDWEVSGPRFILNQTYLGNRTAFIAEVASDTTLSGAHVTWAGQSLGASDTWFAMKQ